MVNEVEIFIPGRLCILGEHSDWASKYRKENKDIERGYTIVAGLNLGIYLKGSCSKDFYYEYNNQKLELSCEEVLSYSKKDFFEYVVSSAKIMIQKYNVKGIKAVCTKMTLPLKKGLSSSAAICVAIIRLYNILYNLNLTIDEEMNLAYEAERQIGSKCGKMDQICAYGQGIRKMSFDGDNVEISNIALNKDIDFVLVDLKGEKNTIKILDDLNKEYPFPKSDDAGKLYYTLGEYNKINIKRAEESLVKGHFKELGKILLESQEKFDENVAPFSKELKAPLLHDFFDFLKNDNLVLGYKGVGSQGDGVAQILMRDSCDCDILIDKIRKNYNYECYKIKIETEKIKAIVPIAGKGTRMYPYTKFIDKAFLPIYSDNEIYPALYLILKELYESKKVSEVDIIINGSQIENIKKIENILKEKNIKLKINSTIQSCIGFGGAVISSDYINSEGYSLVCLGDYIYKNKKEKENSTEQLIKTWMTYRKSVVGIKKVIKEKAKFFGIVSGSWITKNIIKIEKIIEKPVLEEEIHEMLMKYEGENSLFAFFGEYIIENKVLQEACTNLKNIRNQEIGFSEILIEYIRDNPLYGVLIEGESFDLGNPLDYYNSFVKYGENNV